MDSVRDLGIRLSSDLRPDGHINEVIAKAGQAANFVVRAFDCGVPSVYIQAYEALVRPSLLYAAPIWRPCRKRHLIMLDSFQKRFVKRVTYECNTDPANIRIDPVQDVLDTLDTSLVHQLRANPDFCNFFDARSTIKRTGVNFFTPRARNNSVNRSFRWRMSRKLSGH